MGIESGNIDIIRHSQFMNRERWELIQLHAQLHAESLDIVTQL